MHHMLSSLKMQCNPICSQFIYNRVRMAWLEDSVKIIPGQFFSKKSLFRLSCILLGCRLRHYIRLISVIWFWSTFADGDHGCKSWILFRDPALQIDFMIISCNFPDNETGEKLLSDHKTSSRSNWKKCKIYFHSQTMYSNCHCITSSVCSSLGRIRMVVCLSGKALTSTV